MTQDIESCAKCGADIQPKAHCSSRVCPWETCACGHMWKPVRPWEV